MRSSLLFLVFLSVSGGAHASWFGTDNAPAYNNWSANELEAWLNAHNVPIPAHTTTHPTKAELRALVKANWNTATTWTQDQYYAAQRAFEGVRDTTFDSWNESRLREFLLEQGVVEPKGTREQLVLMAKQRYNAYNHAASSFSAKGTAAASGASASASSMASGASASASSMASGASASASSAASAAAQAATDAPYKMSASMTSIAAQATREAGRMLDDSKDYVYSTWDDNRLRAYLKDKGLLKDKKQSTREEMLKTMKNAYGKGPTAPIWDAWSDSYMREWLISHNIIKSDHTPTTREALTAHMKNYYYSTNDKVWSTWSDVDMKDWLVKRGIVKSDAQVSREKLQKLLEDNYGHAQDTLWSGWSDSAMREWLMEHGYLRGDQAATRDEMIKLMHTKYNDAEARSASYLVWPDARLRAYLRERGMSEDALPTSRPGLLQEVRIRWIQTTNRAESLFARVREVVNGGVEAAEEKIGRLMEILGGTYDYSGEKAREGAEYVNEKGQQATGAAKGTYQSGKGAANQAYEKGSETYEAAKARAAEGYEEGKEQAYGSYQEGKHQAYEKTAQGKAKADDTVKGARENVGEKVKRAGQKIKGEL